MVQVVVERASVDAGLCQDADSWRSSCRLSSSDCQGGLPNFRSSRELETVPGAHGGSCTSSKSTQKVNIGQCGEDGPCASVQELCDVPLSWFLSSDDCEVMMMSMNNDDETKTKYGSCSSSDFPDGGNTCFYTDDACDDKLTFNIDDDCTCDKVRVGGCRKKNDDDIVHCGVNAQACDGDSEWLSVVEMKSIKDCYLCREPPAVAPTPSPATVAPTVWPTTSPTPLSSSMSPVIPQIPEMTTPEINIPDDNDKTLAASADQQSFTTTTTNSSTKVGTIIGGVAGAAILAIILLAIVTRNRWQRGGRRTNHNSRPVTSPNGDYA